jgi:single-strand DNA-binding protein
MFTKLVRIGRDAELRYTPNNKAVIGLNCVYDIGYGQNKKSQWIDIVIWDKQAEALAPYLLKGNQIVVTCDDVELETYESNGKTGAKLKARAVNISLCDSKKQEGQAQAQANTQQKQQVRQAPQQQSVAQSQVFDDNFDDDLDLPF